MLTDQEIQEINGTLASRPPEGRIRAAYDIWGDAIAITSAFGYSGIIMMYFLKGIAPELPIYFIDTRRHFPETLELVDTIRSNWGLTIVRVESELSEDEISRQFGQDLHATNPDRCCEIRKVQPFLKVMASRSVWMNALRRDQAATRRHLDILQRDARGTIKFYPLVDWTRAQCWKFIRKHGLPYNPLHDRKYMSIGCSCCTSPVPDGQEERHGRWQSQHKVECGLHVHATENREHHQ